MLQAAEAKLQSAYLRNTILDFKVTYTGDDIALIMSHKFGVGSQLIHSLAWECFLRATRVAKRAGAYGAGQDLLVDASSGNLKGAGPAVAEIEFELLPDHRPAEAFLVFAADKCGPGAYNFHLWNTFSNPMKNGGLLLSPKLAKGFMVTVIDMDYKSKDADRIITLNTPEDSWKLAALLRNIDRFAVESVHSRSNPTEQIISVSATRLHNIAGKYTGKDDPVQICRVQGIFPAPEEVVAPYKVCPYVTGDARGSHTMTLMPMPAFSAVRGEYCQPIVSCLAFSMDKRGGFNHGFVDMFAGMEWDSARQHASLKSDLMREQGFFGVAMASQEEIAYTGLMETLNDLDKKFEIRPT
jgi:fructose 1,6-bisphosphate aldolase/phosphatase